MDWFKINSIDSPKKYKLIFNEIIKEIEDGSAIFNFRLNNVLKQIPENLISKRVSETENYNKKTEALAKLDMLHATKKRFEELVEYCEIRTRTIEQEIKKIEQQYIDYSCVNYLAVSYNKRTYDVSNELYTTYDEPKINKSFFAFVGFLIISTLIIR